MKLLYKIYWTNKLFAILITPLYTVVSGIREYIYILRGDHIKDRPKGFKFFFKVMYCHWQSHVEKLPIYYQYKEKLKLEKENSSQ